MAFKQIAEKLIFVSFSVVGRKLYFTCIAVVLSKIVALEILSFR